LKRATRSDLSNNPRRTWPGDRSAFTDPRVTRGFGGDRGGFERIHLGLVARRLAHLAATLSLALALGCARGGCTAKAPLPEGEGATGRAPSAAVTAPSAAATAPPAPVPARAAADDRQSSLAAAPRSAAQTGKVVRIRDGDSIVVLEGGAQIEVRLHGVDAPELAQAFGRRAKRLAGDLAFGRQVRLETRGKDAYGRTLAEVILPDGRSLNRELVSAGFAWWYRKYTDDADLAAREGAARAARHGLWADADPVPPWEFRESRRR
jgi:micrococcal nuclease